MSHYTFSKVGTLLPDVQAYWPCALVTSDLAGWPWTVTVFSSTDHTDGGVYMYGAAGDPKVPANWESYDAAVARGAFDSFATKPAANPVIGFYETPHVVKIGTQFVLTCHGVVSGLSGQTTVAYIANDYPLNFTLSGTVLSSVDTPQQSEFPQSAGHHTGYFRWGANNFPDIAGAYFGTGLFGSGDMARFAFYTSSDGAVWEVNTLREQEPAVPGVDSGFELTWNEFDPNSVRSIGNGEVVALCALTTIGSGASVRNSEVYELVLSGDGRRTSRNATKVIQRGAVGAYDANEVGQPCTIEYGGEVLCFYQGSVSAQNSLMLAVGSFNPTAGKTTAIQGQNYTTKRFSALGQSSLPSWLTTEGSGTVSVSPGDGVVLTGAAGIVATDAIIPDNESWIEWYIECGYSALTGARVPVLQIGTTGPGDTDTGVMAVSYSSISYDTQLRVRDAGVTGAYANIGNYWSGSATRRHKAGLRWTPSTATVEFIGQNRDLVSVFTATGATTSIPLNPRFSVVSDTLFVEAVELRLGDPDGDAAPVISSALVTGADSLAIELSARCLGDPTGLTVTEEGEVVPGAWTRAGLSSAEFVRDSGSWGAAAVVSVTAASSDLRSYDELVPLAGTTVAEIPIASGLYYVVYDSATTTPTAAQIVSGLAWSSAVAAGYTELPPAGVTSFPQVTGLVGGGYKAAFVLYDGTDYSNVAESAAEVVAAAAELSGAANVSASATAALTTGIALSGAAISISTASGALTAGISLSGSAASVSVASGNLSTSITLSGAALAQAAASAALAAGSSAFSGSASGAATASGALTTGVSMAGNAEALAAAIGVLTAEIRLSGSALSAAVGTGALSTLPSGLSGAAAGSATASGALGTSIALVGEATATVSASGALGVPILLSGAAAAVSSATGDLTLNIQIEGHSLAQALASGSLTTSITLDGAAVSAAVAAGMLDGTVRDVPSFRIHAPEVRSRIFAPIRRAA